MNVRLLILATIFAISSDALFAWGERGHHLISRIASRIAAQRYASEPEFHALFVNKEIMLGHVSNTPDSYWRSNLVTEKERDENAPTHYINLEKIYDPFTTINLPLTFVSATLQVSKRGLSLQKDVGTAPWRVMQLANLMSAELRKAKLGTADSVFSALINAGLLAHFVGDLANPEHTTGDYDGWGVGQGGLHAYFENDIVSELDLVLDQDVFQAGLASAQFVDLTATEDVSHWMLRLAIDSRSKLDELYRLDRNFSLIKESSDSLKLRVPAERRRPSDVAKNFRPFVVARLATAADLLARTWYRAWVEAGRPDLQKYRSYDYAFTPKFVEVDYKFK